MLDVPIEDSPHTPASFTWRGAQALNRVHALNEPMDITGKPMRGFIWVGAEAARGHALRSWIDLASRYVATLPPKQVRAARR